MRNLLLPILLAGSALLTAAEMTPAPAPAPAPAAPAGARFEKEIAGFEAKDKESPPTPGTIEFIGSSTFTRWGTVVADMAPLPVYNHAFGGSQVGDMLRAAPRIVIPNKPKVIVYYCGDNNMTNPEKADPEVPVKGFADFVALIHAELPETRIIYVSIKPSPSRWAVWPKSSEANTRIKALCEADPKLTYVDIAPALLGADGKPDESLYIKDRLHTTPEGYAKITAILKPAVERTWAAVSAH